MLMVLARYNLVQVLAYGLDYGVFWLVLALAPGQLVAANVASKLAAGVFAFVLHKYVTFQKRGTGRIVRELALYFALLGGNTVVATALLGVLTAFLPPLAAKPVADVLCMAVTFVLTKVFVFKDHGPAVSVRD